MTEFDESVYRTILDSLSEGVCVFDSQHTIRMWTRGAEAITGFRAEEVVGRHCFDGILVHVDANGSPLCSNGCLLSRAMVERIPNSAEAFVRHKLGHRVPVYLTSSPLLGPHGMAVGAVQAFHDNSSRVAALERIRELEHLSYLDPLTELANRRYIDIVLQTRCEELQRYGWPFGVVLLDIDDFKVVNDTYGHEAGDQVLQAVARTLILGSRPFDVKGRLGGDEFLAIVANVDAAALAQTATRLRSLVEQTVVRSGSHEIRTTVSLGSSIAVAGDSPREILRRADALLYRSKEGGKNRTCSEAP